MVLVQNSPSVKMYIHFVLMYNRIGLVGGEFANGPGDRGSIPYRVIPKTQKMVLDAALLNTQHYEVRRGGTRGVMVIVTGYGHGDTSSIPGQD